MVVVVGAGVQEAQERQEHGSHSKCIFSVVEDFRCMNTCSYHGNKSK